MPKVGTRILITEASPGFLICATIYCNTRTHPWLKRKLVLEGSFLVLLHLPSSLQLLPLSFRRVLPHANLKTAPAKRNSDFFFSRIRSVQKEVQPQLPDIWDCVFSHSIEIKAAAKAEEKKKAPLRTWPVVPAVCLRYLIEKVSSGGSHLLRWHLGYVAFVGGASHSNHGGFTACLIVQ